MPHGQAFVKRYPSPKDAVYPEIAGLTLCFWYPQAAQVPAIELEPHGPRNIIPPGATASFKEDWYLLAHPFPAAGEQTGIGQTCRASRAGGALILSSRRLLRAGALCGCQLNR